MHCHRCAELFSCSIFAVILPFGVPYIATVASVTLFNSITIMDIYVGFSAILRLNVIVYSHDVAYILCIVCTI